MSILNQPRLSMAQAARQANVHLSTLWRWTLKGVRGCRLNSVRVGGQRFVLIADLEAFIAALNDHPRPVSTRSDVRQRAAAAGRQLDALSITVKRR